MLNLLEEYLPIARMEWDTVCSLHNLRFPGTNRTVESLRRKFISLRRKQVETGNPHIPGDVLRAKSIKHQITERADMGDDDDIIDEHGDVDFDDDSNRTGTAGTQSGLIPDNAVAHEQPTETATPVTPFSAGNSSSTPSPLSLLRPVHPRPLVHCRALPARGPAGGRR